MMMTDMKSGQRRPHAHCKWGVWVLSLALLVGCGESTELRIQQARIAMANAKPSTALSIVGQVLAQEPDHPDALLIQARAQIQLERLGPAKLTLDRLHRNRPDDPDIAWALLAWAQQTFDASLDNPTFAVDQEAQQRFADAHTVALDQLTFLDQQPDDQVRTGYSRALIHQSDTTRLRLLIKHTHRMINELGPDAAVAGPGQAPSDETPPPETYVQHLRQLEHELAQTRETLLTGLELLLEQDPRHVDAAVMYLRTAENEKDRPRLTEQIRKFAQVQDLPLMIANSAIIVLLGMPQGAAPMAQRVSLGWDLLRAIPTDQAESQTRRIASARLMLAENDTDKAVPILEKLLGEGSLDAEAHYLLAHALFTRGRYTRCREVIARMFPAMDSVPQVQALYGLTLWRLGEPDAARQALRTAYRLDPDDPLTREAFAILMAEQGYIDVSGEDIEAYYQMDPSNPHAVQLKIQHAIAVNDNEQVKRLLDQIQNRPDLTDDQVRLLLLANESLGRPNQTLKWSQEQVRRTPDQLDAWMSLAAVLLDQGNEQGLDEALKQIAKRFPGAPAPELITGELYLQIKQYQRANEVLGRVVLQQPDNMNARLALARSLAVSGRFAFALREVLHILDVLPDDTQALALGARIALAVGQSQQATGFLDRIDPARIDPEDDPALAAQLHLRSGDLDAATDICTRAMASGNQSPLLRLVMTRIYQEKGQLQHAEDQLTALVRHFPNSAEAFAWLSQFYASQGLTDQGVKRLKEAELYNETFARLAQASLLRSADRLSDAINVLNPLLDRLISQRDPMATTVADEIAQLYKQLGDDASASGVYDRLYTRQSRGSALLIKQLIESWDLDSPRKRRMNLDAAAARASADNAAGLIELSRRYAMLGRNEQALSVVQRGLSRSPKNAALLNVKAGLLVIMGRSGEAVAVYRSALQIEPLDTALRLQYARALSVAGQHPHAEDELLNLVRSGGDGTLAARATLLEVYLGLGLQRRAVSAVDVVLDKTPVGDNAALDHAIGKTLAAAGRYAEARHRLQAIPDGSPYYASSQIILAHGELAGEDDRAAQARIKSMVANPKTADQAVKALLKLDPGSPRALRLLSWADESIDLDTLAAGLAGPWLNLSLKLADRRGDWQRVGDRLDRQLKWLAPDEADRVAALRVVLLYHMGQADEAKRTLAQFPRLEGSATGSLLSLALNTTPPKAGRRHPMADILNAIIQGDRSACETAAQNDTGIRTLFADDLLRTFDDPGTHPGANPGTGVDLACRDLAMATVAMQGGLAGLAGELSASAIDNAPAFIPSYALSAAAASASGAGVSSPLDRVRAVAPDSSLFLLLTVIDSTSAGDHRAAIQPLEQLLKRHESNPYLQYQLAQELNAAGMKQQAIQALEPIASGKGPYRLSASNDLAYLLASQGTQRLDEAANLAGSVLQAAPNSPALMDTVGWIEHLRGRDQAALVLLSKSIPALSQIPEAHYHIGAVYHALGQKRWARYHLGQAASGPQEVLGVQQARDLLKQMGDDTAWP